MRARRARGFTLLSRGAPRPLTAGRAGGFTLVELLIVIAIIGLLAGISFPAYLAVQRHQKSKETSVLIENLKLALDHYENDFHAYPPSDPKKVGIRTNGLDDGIKCLVRCLTSQKKQGGPYWTADDKVLQNLTSDLLPAGQDPTASTIKARDLFEIVDAFGNPLVYLNNADYDKGQMVQLGPNRVKARGVKSQKTGQYEGFNSYQLWSVGPNGEDDGGGEDDITSWGGP